jgi:hypothetical protein
LEISVDLVMIDVAVAVQGTKWKSKKHSDSALRQIASELEQENLRIIIHEGAGRTRGERREAEIAPGGCAADDMIATLLNFHQGRESKAPLLQVFT